MLLGDLIARLEDEAVAGEALMSLDDLSLVSRVGEAAARHDIQPGEYVVEAVGAFTNGASDEDWVTVIGLMSRAEDPGRVFLQRVVSYALAAEERPAT